MKGENVKNRLKIAGISISDIAHKMGLNTEDMHTMLSSECVPCDVLRKIEEAAGKSMFFIYENLAPTNSISGNGNTLGDNNNLDNSATMRLLDIIEKKDQQIDKLLNIIEKNKH